MTREGQAIHCEMRRGCRLVSMIQERLRSLSNWRCSSRRLVTAEGLPSLCHHEALVQIAATYSHLNGEEYLLARAQATYSEIQEVIAAVDASRFQTKVSKEKTML